jgi:hypothetical protein
MTFYTSLSLSLLTYTMLCITLQSSSQRPTPEPVMLPTAPPVEAVVQCISGDAYQAGQYEFAGVRSPCPAGSYCPSNSKVKVDCAAGTIQPAAASSSCLSCSVGTYAASTGQVACMPCDLGASSLVGASSCTLCASGYYRSGSPGTCSIMATCNLATEYYEYSSQFEANRVCRPLSPPCETNYLTLKKPCSSLASDTSVTPTTRMCRFRDEYMLARNTTTLNRICIKHVQCKNDEYMYSEYLTDSHGLVLRNQTCKAYHECENGEYHVVNGRKKWRQTECLFSVYHLCAR